ncbi:MAG TPA: hypothetical protein PLO62_10325 [Candidatus Hydrogenedentes bacterium]|nr:hypothetical protein [Candidatus Hydrogenedentota bacterium]HOS02246.1 hypothetical protein [Candidatus Hydrogenedentota bacterium]
MRGRKAIVALLVVSASLSLTALSQRRLDAMRTAAFDEELLYLPNEHLLDHFTAGLSGVVADVLWLKCIQYTSTHFRGDFKFTWLDHMCTMITRLDPYFVDVYRYGGIFLAALKADDDASIRLLKSGIPPNPDRWELPYEIAMVHMVNRRDQPGAAEAAAAYLKLAVATGTAPENVAHVAAGLQRKNKLTDMERAMWTDMAQHHADKFMRDLASRKLALLDMRLACEELEQAAEAYAARTGSPPRSLRDITDNAERIDPLGGTFFLDSTGRVQNTSLLNESVDRALGQLRNAVRLYRKDAGSWPGSLDDLVSRQIMTAIPKHPYEDKSWRYDPATGEIVP